LLALQPRDALAELDARDLELGLLPVADIVEVEHLAHLVEREADIAAHQDVLQAGAVAPAVAAFLAIPPRAEQPLLLVEAQRARRHAAFPAEVANGENLAAFRRQVTARQRNRGFSLGHDASPDAPYVAPVYVNVKQDGKKKRRTVPVRRQKNASVAKFCFISIFYEVAAVRWGRASGAASLRSMRIISAVSPEWMRHSSASASLVCCCCCSSILICSRHFSLVTLRPSASRAPSDPLSMVRMSASVKPSFLPARMAATRPRSFWLKSRMLRTRRGAMKPLAS